MGKLVVPLHQNVSKWSPVVPKENIILRGCPYENTLGTDRYPSYLTLSLPYIYYTTNHNFAANASCLATNPAASDMEKV